MYIPFKELPDSSRIWIYQSDKELSVESVSKINGIMENFINGWNNHGEGLKGSFQIKYNQFLILAVDENYKSASGCSIDSSVQIMKKIEKEFDVKLFDRMQTAFKDGDTINLVSMLDFKKFAEQDKITPKTIVFNNMVNTKADFLSKWEIAAEDSWHARFF